MLYPVPLLYIPLLENETLFDSRKFREMCDMGRLMEDQFLSLLSYVADQERKKIHQRRAEGIAVAKISRETFRTSSGEPFNPKQTTNAYDRRNLFLMEKWRNNSYYVYVNVRAKEKHVL